MTNSRASRVGCFAAVTALISIAGCQAPPPNPEETRSIAFLTWIAGEPNSLDQRLLRDFTDETGISVRLIPGAESASRRLTQELNLMNQRSSAVDVFQVDTIWPGIVADHLIDLKNATGIELESELPQAVETATIGGRLVAAPFSVDYPLLYYRSDLLRKYGFAHPPKTWDELEAQAQRIQRGEQAQGHGEFWGYVWQGADYEGLTCNALEWQSSEGGGIMLERDRTVDVANPAAVRAFQRAARWVGGISPPGVTAYLEEDSRNMWQSGRAAFLRNWNYAYSLARASTEVGKRFGVTPLPAGPDPHSSVLGGSYLGVSKYSRHRDDAIALVKYLTSRGVQRKRAIEGGFLPTFPSLYQDPAVLGANPYFASLADMPKRLIQRPAALAGKNYDRVSRAYAHGVHAILTDSVTASEGAGEIQRELMRVTGFPANAAVVVDRTMR